MTVTSGFFNSVNHDRLYDAEQISSMFDGLILDGVYQGYGDAFFIKPYSDANSTIIVGTGRAWFDHTWLLNDTEYTIELEPPNGMLSRIDAIVLDINKEEETRKNSILCVQGTFAESNAQKPALINTELHKQYPLVYITIPAGDDGPILADNIENCVGTDACPLVEAVLDTMDVTMFIAQMEAKFYTWFDKLQDVMDSNTALKLQHQIDDLEAYVDEQDQKYMLSTRNYENVPRKNVFKQVMLNDYMGINIRGNIIPYIDDGVFYYLVAKKNSNTSITHKLIKLTLEGVITELELENESISSSSGNILCYSQITKSPEGELVGGITSAKSSKITVYKFLEDGTYQTVTSVTGLSNIAPQGKSIVFDYCDAYGIYVYISGTRQYSYMTSNFVNISQKKTIGDDNSPFIEICGKYAVAASNSAGGVKFYDLDPESWTSSSYQQLDEDNANKYIGPTVKTKNGLLIPGNYQSQMIPSTSDMPTNADYVGTYFDVYQYQNDDILSDTRTLLGNFSHYTAVAIGGTFTIGHTYSSVSFGTLCRCSTDDPVYVCVANTLLGKYPDNNPAPAILMFNLNTFQIGVIPFGMDVEFTDGASQETQGFYHKDYKWYALFADDGAYTTQLSMGYVYGPAAVIFGVKFIS